MYVEPFQPKEEEEEENSMHNTVVMFSTSDLFTLRQVTAPDERSHYICLSMYTCM